MADTDDDLDNTKNNQNGGLGSLLSSIAPLAATLGGPALTQPGYNNAVSTGQAAQNQLLTTPIPSLQALTYTPTQQTVQGQLNPLTAATISQGPSAYNNISTNPAYTGAANNALGQLQNISTNGGLTATDQAQLNAIQQSNATQARGANSAILQSAQQRGMAGNGVTLLNQMLNQQGQATNNNTQGLQVAADAQQRALAAMQGAGQLGAGLQAQSYGQQAQAAASTNAINQYNSSNAQNVVNANTAAQNTAQAGNLGNAQQVANTNATANTAASQYNAAQNQTQEQDINQVNNENVNAAKNTATAQGAQGGAQTAAGKTAAAGATGALNAIGGAGNLFNGVSNLFS